MQAELGSDSDSSEGEELIQDEVPTSEGLHKPVIFYFFYSDS